MLQIKIQCGCGQLYEFDVEPVNGKVPGTVACPACGVDGTAAANAFIAQNTASPPATSSGAGLRLSASPRQQQAASSRPIPSRIPGQVDPDQAVLEARAKISWGDSPKEVTGYLMSQGFTYQDASELVKTMFDERATTIRKTGMIRICSGLGVLCLAAVIFVTALSGRRLRIGSVAIMVFLGGWSMWLLAKGIFMVAAPRAEDGDVADK